MKEKVKEIYSKIDIYVIYTIIFSVLFFLIYSIFLKAGKSFIWREDGLEQHFAILYNFNVNLRNIFTNGINLFSWETGLGLDMIEQYSYYILGDPFAYLSLLFPMDKLELAYDMLIIIRMYFIGIAFLCYCKYNKKSNFNSMLGCIIYTFSGFVIYAGLRHPYFLNAVILLPLVFLGIDKILKENKIGFFIVIIAITAIVNYYFLYMITILALIYSVVKYISEYKEEGFKVFINKFLKTCLGYIIGILIAGIILLPTINGYLNSNRLSNYENVKYNLRYYASVFTGLISNNFLYWTRICTASITLILLPVSLLNIKKDKENRTIIINIIITTIMLLLQFCGSFMNGLSFSTNRWSFGYIFLLSYMVVLNFRQDLKYSKKELISMIVLPIIYYIVLILLKGIVEIRICFVTNAIAILIFAIIAVTNYLKRKDNVNSKIFKYLKYLIFLIVLINIVFYGRDLYSKSGKKYINEFVKSNSVINKYSDYNKKIKKFDEAIETIKKKDKTFYRISTNKYKLPNASLVYNYKSINSYLSLGNKYIGKLSKELENRGYYSDTNPLREFDNRTKITTLLGTKYFIVNEKNKEYVPYGYELYDEINTNNKITQIYKNKNYLGLGIFYDNYILENEYNKLNALEKEQAIIESAVLKEKPENNVNENLNLINKLQINTVKDVNYKITKSSEVKDNKVKIKKKKQKVILEIDNVENSELYILIKGFNYKGTEENNIKIKYDNITKVQNFRDKEMDPYYFYNPNILINLGYKDIHKNKIEIVFPNKGTYSWDKIKIYAIPMETYDKAINKIKENEFKLEKYENDKILGNIQNENSGILQLSIPYTKGWTAYVDGKKTDTIVVNTAFIGILLEKGNHKIELKYETPLLKVGVIFTILGLISFIVVVIYEKNLKIKNRDENGNK